MTIASRIKRLERITLNKRIIQLWLDYGDTYTQAVEATGAEVQTLMNYKWVAKTIETSRRRDKTRRKSNLY